MKFEGDNTEVETYFGGYSCLDERWWHTFAIALEIVIDRINMYEVKLAGLSDVVTEEGDGQKSNDQIKRKCRLAET